MKTITSKDDGYLLLIVAMLLAVGGLLVSASLRQNVAGAHTVQATQVRSTDYFEAESEIANTVSWLRANSQSLTTPFRRENFYASFDKGIPAVGKNDSTLVQVPSKLKIAGTDDSPILVSDAQLASARFPASYNITTGSLFDAPALYAATEVGNAHVRVTLIDAVPFDPTKDYGPPPNAVPETDFSPVYRIDSFTDFDEGSHVYATVSARLVHRFDVGIYGQDDLTIRQPCDSYKSSEGDYSPGTRRANCPAASNSETAIHKNEEVYGSLKTNGEINSEPPWGGTTCADFESGCPNKGETCAGEDCGVPLLDEFYDWATYCPTNQGNLSVPNNTTLELVINGDTTHNRCWGTVTVGNGSVLRLVTTTNAYFFQTLTFSGGQSRMEVTPNPAAGTVELYVLNITGNSFNGNQAVNTLGRPTQFTLNYLGTNDLLLNGNAAMKMAMVAPNATVTVSGSFEYSGALLAKRLLLTGSSGIHYDEDLGGGGPVVDVQYRIKDVVQLYR